MADSLTNIQTPIRIINLGSRENVPAGINGFEISETLDNAEIYNIVGATHFSFLGECTEIGEAIIKSETDEPICSEQSNRKRSDIHQELKPLIADFLIDQLEVN